MQLKSRYWSHRRLFIFSSYDDSCTQMIIISFPFIISNLSDFWMGHSHCQVLVGDVRHMRFNFIASNWDATITDFVNMVSIHNCCFVDWVLCDKIYQLNCPMNHKFHNKKLQSSKWWSAMTIVHKMNEKNIEWNNSDRTCHSYWTKIKIIWNTCNCK